MSNKKPNAFWALIVKFGAKLAPYIPKFLKAIKFLKFGLAAASFATYAYMFTWKFALLLMIALAWHESGHVWAMRKMGIKTKGFYFIPFIGGAAVAEEQYKSYGQNSFVAIMGPIWGLILAMMCVVLYYTTGLPLFAAAAGWMAFLNLFNLFPVSPLDGGQIVRSIAFSIHKNLGFVFLIFSLIAATFLMFKLHIGLFAFVIMIGVADLIVEFFRRKRTNTQVVKYEDLAENYHESGDKITEKHYTKRAKKLKLTIPTSMKGKEFAYSILAYAATVVALIVIVKVMGQVPGASLASEFLADK